MSATSLSFISRGQNSPSSSSEAVDVDPFPILDLPIELHGYICKYLNLRDTQNLVCTTKRLRDLTLKEANRYQLVAVRIFMETISSKLVSACPEQIALFDLQDQLLDQEVVPLSELKNKMMMLRDQMIDILSTLDESVLNDFSEINPPNFYEKVVAIAKNLAAISILNSEETSYFYLFEDDPRLTALCEDCLELIRNQEARGALKIINAIFDKGLQKWIVKEITEIFIKNSEFEEAVKSITLLRSKQDQAGFLAKIVRALIKKGDILQALKIAKTMPDSDHLEEVRLQRALALRNIVKAFTRKGELEQAAEISKMVPRNVVKILILDKEFDEALKVASNIPDEEEKARSFKQIAEASSKPNS
ncbi:MAG: hypothetical protein Q8L98_03490 [Chlamydiales bacterium]|nr:hypothetical protein [Chlamydiales bacterium]